MTSREVRYRAAEIIEAKGWMKESVGDGECASTAISAATSSLGAPGTERVELINLAHAEFIMAMGETPEAANRSTFPMYQQVYRLNDNSTEEKVLAALRR